MTRRLTDGAEYGDVTTYWDSVSGATASTTIKRSGAYSYYFSTTSQYANKGINLYEFYYRYSFYAASVIGSTSKILSWYETSEAGSLRLDTLGRLIAYNPSGSTGYITTRSLKTSQQNLIELHLLMDDTNGVIQVKINNVLCLDYAGPTSTTAGACTILRHGYFVHYIDDIALNDTTGDVNNSWCGDGHLETLKGTSNGDVNNWIPNTGTNWEAIDEVSPDGDTTYVATSGIGVQDMYNVGDFTMSGKLISMIWTQAIAKDNAIGGGSILNLGVKTGGTVYLGSGIVLTSVYEPVVGEYYLTNPYTSSGWTQDDLNNIQIVMEGN